MSTKIELKKFMTDILTFSLFRVGCKILYIQKYSFFFSNLWDVWKKRCLSSWQGSFLWYRSSSYTCSCNDWLIGV